MCPACCPPLLPWQMSCPMLVIVLPRAMRVSLNKSRTSGSLARPSPHGSAGWPPQVLVENCTSAANAVLRALPMPAGASKSARGLSNPPFRLPDSLRDPRLDACDHSRAPAACKARRSHGANGFQSRTQRSSLMGPQRFFSSLVFDTVATALHPLGTTTQLAV